MANGRQFPLSAMLLTLVACQAPETEPGAAGACMAGKCDDVLGIAVCDDVFVDASGTVESLVELGDPLARLALTAGEGCPTDAIEALSKLEHALPACDQRLVSVSENSRHVGPEEASFRAVMDVSCGFSDTSSVFASFFGLRVGDVEPALSRVEFIGRDDETGVFNFYVVEDGTWTYFGSSGQFVDLYTDDTNHASYAHHARQVQSEDTPCAACHTGGGLIMKELRAPWVHWGDGPGGFAMADRLLEAFAQREDDLGVDEVMKVGTLQPNALEVQVRTNNAIWNRTRIEERRRAGQLRALLRPLFCSVETNLTSVDGVVRPEHLLHEAAGVTADLVPFRYLDEDYAEARDAVGQVLRVGADVVGRDTVPVSFTTPEVAGADIDYIEQLSPSGLGVIDDAFVLDVLSVDFTRPAFSDERCELLRLVPERVTPADVTPAGIRAVLVAALEDHGAAAGTPAADLLTNLVTEDEDAIATAMRTYVRTCQASTDFIADFVAVKALDAARARSFPVLEFEASMPMFDPTRLPPIGTRLHPATCEPHQGYVSLRR